MMVLEIASGDKNLRILILGPSGQIGYELSTKATQIADVITAGRSAADIIFNPLDYLALANIFASVQPDIVINAIAYTAVDKAESDQEQAFLLNSSLPETLAKLCEKHNCLLIHYSTDFVFDGSLVRPWIETDITNPLSIYGRSKLEGENAIKLSSCKSVILRTSWVYGERGSNFLLTMLRLGRERDSLSVVNDQIGSPSYSGDIALATLQLCLKYREDPDLNTELAGIFHLTSSGETSWYGFAKTIFELASEFESFTLNQILPISTAEYPTPARRPAYSVLNCTKLKTVFDIEMSSWKESLQQCIRTYYHSRAG